MKKRIIYELNSLYRDSFRITGYEFGEGEKSACIIGSMRGNEIQQIYCCSQLVKRLKEMEAQGRMKEGKSILVIPSCNPYSVNIERRFWPTDNTDINRMFPGYNKGETTQRIAAGIFEEIKDYKNGIQFPSFYMPGTFVPHVRMMDTGYQDVELAKQFGLPYVMLRTPKPYDSTTLNYNWQIWETNAFSVYTNYTETIDDASMKVVTDAVLRYLGVQGILDYRDDGGAESEVVKNTELTTVISKYAGIYRPVKKSSDHVAKGETVVRIVNPYDGELVSEVKAPKDGVIFFMHNKPVTYTNTTLFSLIPD